MSWCQNMTPAAATLLVIFGLIYLLFGWYIFKILVTLNAALDLLWVALAFYGLSYVFKRRPPALEAATEPADGAAAPARVAAPQPA